MKTELVICMGSSCFARGNKTIHKVILDYIQKHHLSESLKLKGNHCFGHCCSGPVVKINEKVYEEVNEESIIDLLDKEFGLS